MTAAPSVVVDVGYSEAGARAAAVCCADRRFAEIVEERTADLSEVAEYVPGQLYLRELPAIAEVLERLTPGPSCEGAAPARSS